MINKIVESKHTYLILFIASILALCIALIIKS